MKKLKNLLHDSFFTQTANIGIIVIFALIIVVQIYKIYHLWIHNNLRWIYDFVNSNDVVIRIVLMLIPLIVSFFLFVFRKIKTVYTHRSNRNNLNSKNEISEKTDDRTYMFPGFISKEILNNNVILVKDLEITSDYNAPLILDREKQCEDIILKLRKLKSTNEQDKFSCLYLTGMSGSGKSVLLNNFLLEKLNNDGDIVTIINDNYNNGDLIYKKIKSDKSNIVIFDQFEESINYPSFFTSIKKMFQDINLNRIVYIFSFPQNYFYQIDKKLSEIFYEEIEKNPSFISSITHFITNDKHDIDELKIIINRFTQEDFSNIERCLSECRKCTQTSGSYKSILQEQIFSPSLIFLCSILSRIEVGVSPLVEFSTLSFIYEIYEQEISANLEMYIDNLDNIIDLYLNKWVEEFPHSQTGKIILYLLSDRKVYTMDDIKFTTFESEEYFENGEFFNIAKTINENKFLSVKEKYNGFNKGFSAIHDYIGSKISEYCFRNLDNGIRQNIDFYRKTMSKSSESRRPTAFSSEKIKIQKRYNTFNGKVGKYIINIFLALMCISSLIITLLINDSQTDKKYYDNGILLSIGCLLAIYYYYNFIMQSTRILTYKAYLPMLSVGAIAVPLCYLFPNYYGIFMGITLCSLGLTQFFIGFGTVYDARKHFLQTGILYFLFGIAVVAFGIVYNLFPAKFYHWFFILYVLGANYGHTKYSYVIERIGRINTIKL